MPDFLPYLTYAYYLLFANSVLVLVEDQTQADPCESNTQLFFILHSIDS